MHKQVYFHKTRLACNVHIHDAVKEMLPLGVFPRPDSGDALAEYLKWDDFRVLSEMAQGAGGDGALRLSKRNHFRLLHQSEETSNDLVLTKREAESFNCLREALGDRVRFIDEPKNTWYKSGNDIQVIREEDRTEIHPLSEYSPLLRSINFGRQRYIYVDKADVPACLSIRDALLSKAQAPGHAPPDINISQETSEASEIAETASNNESFIDGTTQTKAVQSESPTTKGVANAS